MLNLFLAMLPAPSPTPDDADEGVLGKLVLWAHDELRYRQALIELGRLDDRELDELAIDRADFPALARRHVLGAAPLSPAEIAGHHQH